MSVFFCVCVRGGGGGEGEGFYGNINDLVGSMCFGMLEVTCKMTSLSARDSYIPPEENLYSARGSCNKKVQTTKEYQMY